MNKYQEALNYLDFYCSVRHTEQQDLLQELVDRETPVKPIIKRSTHGHLMWGTCDVCKSEEAIWFGQRCNNNECGQKQDCSDEE